MKKIPIVLNVSVVELVGRFVVEKLKNETASQASQEANRIGFRESLHS